nr:MAG TPA: hypothetical protein [Caudoviricetes sp.]
MLHNSVFLIFMCYIIRVLLRKKWSKMAVFGLKSSKMGIYVTH